MSDGSPRLDFDGWPVTPAMSPRWTSISPVRSTGQISWMRPAAVDELEEGRASPCRAARGRGRRGGAPRRPRRPASSVSASARTAAISSRFGKALRFHRRQPRASRGLAPHHPGAGPVLGRLALPDDLEAVAFVEGEVGLAVRQERARDAVAGRGLEAGLQQGGADPVAAAAGLDADPGEVPVRLGDGGGAHRLDRAPVGEEAGRRLADADRRRDQRPQHRPDVDLRASRAAASARSRRASPSVTHTSASVTSKLTRKSHGRSAARRSALGTTHSQAGSS